MYGVRRNKHAYIMQHKRHASDTFTQITGELVFCRYFKNLNPTAGFLTHAWVRFLISPSISHKRLNFRLNELSLLIE